MFSQIYKPQILVIRAGALGDALLSTPIIRKLWNDRQGNCFIDVSTENPEAFRNNPYIRQVLKQSDLIGKQYDQIINLDLAYEKNPLMHITHAYSLHAFGNDFNYDMQPELHATEAEKQNVSNYVQSLPTSNFIVMHMRQHTWPSRNLKISFWQELVSKIIDKTDLTIVQVGANHEIAFEGNSRLVNALGKFTIHELKELIQTSKGFVGMDCATVHVAACTDKPLIGFFTSAHHEYRKPLGNTPFYSIAANIECYGCQKDNLPPCTIFICNRNDVECINRFNADSVVETIKTAVL